MFRKGKSVGEDYRLQPQQRSAVAPTTAALAPSNTISSIGSNMAIVGKIVCKDLIKVYRFVEGELYASNALIADGARLEGEIVAEQLTIAGRVKGDVHALRVKLEGTAVVEGDIFHHLLSVHENARFEGCSWPEDTPPEPRPTINAESSYPLPPNSGPLAASDQKQEFRGASNGESKQDGKRGRAGISCCLRRNHYDRLHRSFRAQRHPRGDRTCLCDRGGSYRSELDGTTGTALTLICARGAKPLATSAVTDNAPLFIGRP